MSSEQSPSLVDRWTWSLWVEGEHGRVDRSVTEMGTAAVMRAQPVTVLLSEKGRRPAIMLFVQETRRRHVGAAEWSLANESR